MSNPYISDSNGQKMYEGSRVWTYSETDDITPVYGTLKLSEVGSLHKWSVVWDDLGELFWTELKPIYMGDDPTSDQEEEPPPIDNIP